MKKERAAVEAAPPTNQTLNQPQIVKVEPLMTRETLAEYLAIHPHTLDKYVRGRLIPYIKIGRARSAPIRFRRSAVEEALTRMSSR